MPPTVIRRPPALPKTNATPTAGSMRAVVLRPGLKDVAMERQSFAYPQSENISNHQFTSTTAPSTRPATP